MSTVAHPDRPVRWAEAWSDEEGAARAAELFRRTYGREPEGVWAAPGRVNLIGEHTDYNGGLCLPIALPHRTFVALARRDDGGAGLVSDLAPERPWRGRVADVAPGTVEGWVTYAAGVAWALAEDGLAVGGFDAAVASCVPLGAGLSSSAALECSVAVALDEAYGLGQGGDDAGRSRLVTACIRTENEVAGAATGGMDQAASLRSQQGHALLLDTRDDSVTQVPFDLAGAGLELLVIDTKAPHSLNDGQYAARRATCEAAARVLGVGTLREVTDLPAALAALGDEEQRRRVRHVVTEIARVEDFAAEVRAGQVRQVGHLMDASHESLRVDYEVTCPELDVAVAAARAAGALGARMTGGGFGGSAIALVEAGSSPAVAEAVAAAFAEQRFAAPEFLVAVASGPARRVS
ncbi:galactokinase [Cellulomonas marina]|uniref:Galactokinase n=1 Tax=Cellulomonas marina TaxID=988821 RepID=A0A1I0Z6S3_9CELL|nr:galactokinase [Cellulomonas marina]GIG29061.1 galactokinase [Cellulomonas marina]SFB21449.1 galactokinase [Cellulomonas marina]